MDETFPKSVIPVSKNVVQMMQTRLEEVEDSANQLTKEIVSAKQHGSTDRLSILLSKTQSMESVLQSLKLNFVNLSTLTRQPSDLEQKLVEMTDVYTEEVKKLSSENAHLKSDKQELNEKRQQTELDLQRVKITLDQFKNIQMEKEDAILAERNRVESLLRKVAELDLQLAEERQLRFGLDRTNTELGQRLDEMDLMLKQEHLETQNFTGDFIKLKKDYGKKCEELKQEKVKQKEMESEMITVCQELDAKLTQLEVLKQEKGKITHEITTVHDKYNQLNSQLETMQHLFTDYQKDKAEMEADAVKLNARIEELNSENSSLTQELVWAQKNDDSARLIDSRQQLRHMTKEHDQLKSDNEVLAERVTALECTCEELDKELENCRKSADKETESKFAVIGGLQDRLSSLKSELMSLEGEKENLLTEVNGAVDAMDGERSALQADLDSCQQQLSAALDDLEEEKQKSNDLETKLHAYGTKPDFMHFDRRLSELTEQKNSLSYENGKLQSQVEQLQGQVHSLTCEQKQFDKISKKLSHAEGKNKKLKNELDSCKQALSQSELTSQQLQTTSEMRETDYNSAMRSREEAFRDARALAARLETLEEALQQQEEMKSEMEERLREDNSKVTESLENMMALHTEIQCKYESLQIQLGKKDTQINEFKKDKKKQQDKLSRVENQLELVSGKLSQVQDKQANQSKGLEKEIKSVKTDNSKLVRTLQDTLDLNEQLRAQVSLLEETLCKQKSECDRLSTQSKDLENKLRQQGLSYAARISELDVQVGKEWDKASQHVEVKSSEITELNKKNDALRLKLGKLKDEVNQLKGELKYKNKRILKLKDVDEESKSLYTANEELTSRCRSQEKTINRFISQFKEVQGEMRELVSLHTAQTETLEEKERLLHVEEMRSNELRKNYHECKKQVALLQEQLKTTEIKLMEANNDTQIATETLEDTNRYFKERFSALSSELSSAKRHNLNAELNNLEKHHQLTLEQQRVDETACKARDMIKAARHQLTDIADRTDFEQSIREHSRSILPQRPVDSLLSPPRRDSNMAAAGDTTIDNILSVSQQRSPPYRVHDRPLQQQALLSPFTSSSQKLDAIIEEMEKKRLIT